MCEQDNGSFVTTVSTAPCRGVRPTLVRALQSAPYCKATPPIEHDYALQLRGEPSSLQRKSAHFGFLASPSSDFIFKSKGFRANNSLTRSISPVWQPVASVLLLETYRKSMDAAPVNISHDIDQLFFEPLAAIREPFFDSGDGYVEKCRDVFERVSCAIEEHDDHALALG